MSSTPKQRLQALSEHLTTKSTDPATTEDLPKIRRIAPNSAGPRIQGKVAIVTGANSPLGIGLATAHQYAHNGARALYICDLNPSNLSTHAHDLSKLYPTVDIHTRSFDASDETALKAVIDDAIQRYGRLDIFFANAGIVGTHTPFFSISTPAFLQTLHTNVLSVFLAIKHAAPAMQLTSSSKPESGGSIIATGSVAGIRSNAGSTDYSASKAAVGSLVQTCAWQLAGTGVRVNAVLPGLVETGMTRSVYERARERGTEGRVGGLNPLRRGGVADEVARVVLFLGSEEASYVNGQGWAVDGGLSAGHPVVPGKLA